MKSVWRRTSQILTGLFVTAVSALPQAYTISAKPGVVNYIEGTVLLNGQPISGRELKSTFLAANDVLSTEAGKAEVLLAPGIFLRVGDNSQVRMISPSLVDTQIEMQHGEAMIEADELVKDNRISVVDHGASITIEKTGLYRFTGGDNPTAAAIEGKAVVYFGEKKVDVSKGREAELTDDLKVVKFDSNKEDDLYAWSNIRAEYDASATYQSARNASLGNYSAFGGGYGPYGYGMMGSGWLWNSGFSSWAWLPGEGAFFSPFGYGFYGAGLLGYAPVIPVYLPGGIVKTPVPINPKHPPVAPALRSGTVAASPAAYEAARAQVARSYMASGGFHTASGAVAPEFSSPHGAAGGHPLAHASFGSSGGSTGGGGGGHASGGGVSSASVGSAGHSGGGGGGHSK